MVSVQLDSKTEAALERLSSQRGQDKAEIIREAIDLLAHREQGPTAYDHLRSFIGTCDSGGQQLSEKTGKKFQHLLESKYRARCPD